MRHFRTDLTCAFFIWHSDAQRNCFDPKPKRREGVTAGAEARSVPEAKEKAILNEIVDE